MKNLGLVAALVAGLAVAASGAESQRHIGLIDAFGTVGVDWDRILATMTVHIGDNYSSDDDSRIEQAIKTAVMQVTGREPTDVAPVCCHDKGDQMIYVGLPGANYKSLTYNPSPRGSVRLDPAAVALYQRMSNEWGVDVSRGGGRVDNSKGYVLSTSDSELRSIQLEMRAYALKHGDSIRRALESSSDVHGRQAAAMLLGYAKRSREQIEALVSSSRDPDDTVRNNATRALMVLAESDEKVAAQIPGGNFVSMLNSGVWSDRNKGSWLLLHLTRSRDPKLLTLLRAKALGSLEEMARWQEYGHALPARMMLGRIAGIDEGALAKLANSGQADAIIQALGKSAR